MRPTIALLLLSLLGAASSAPTAEVAESAPAAELEKRTVGGVGLPLVYCSNRSFPAIRPKERVLTPLKNRSIYAPMSASRVHVVTRSSP